MEQQAAAEQGLFLPEVQVIWGKAGSTPEPPLVSLLPISESERRIG